jgi:hypothetical protein
LLASFGSQSRSSASPDKHAPPWPPSAEITPQHAGLAFQSQTPRRVIHAERRRATIGPAAQKCQFGIHLKPPTGQSPPGQIRRVSARMSKGISRCRRPGAGTYDPGPRSRNMAKDAHRERRVTARCAMLCSAGATAGQGRAGRVRVRRERCAPPGWPEHSAGGSRKPRSDK